MRLGVLGPLQPERVTRPAQRRLLSILILEGRRGIDRDRLIHHMWGERPPNSARNALQVHVNGLRKQLPPGAIETIGTGYRLSDTMTVDVDTFGAAITRAANRARHRDRLADLSRGLDLWRGDPYPELAGDGFAKPEINRLTELHATAREMRAEALIGIGQEAEAITDLRLLAADDPLRESVYGHLMLALYRTGRQADALREYQIARTTMGEELGIEPSPWLRKLEGRILLQDPRLGSPASAEYATNIVQPTTSFVGREQDLERVTDALGERRCVTIVGAPGLGKTRLATEVGVLLSPEFADGVWLVELSGASTALDVAASIATVMELQVNVGSMEELGQAVANRDCLIILDNCEHVLDACRLFAAEITRSRTGASLLATSRQTLRVDGETFVKLEPLGSGANPMSDPAVHLFLDRAHSSDPSFSVDDESADAVATLVGKLDGVPLAIELAARWTSSLGVTQINELFDSLSTDWEHPLGSTIDWSLELLAHDDRDLLFQTAVFHDPFSLEAAHAVCRPNRSVAHFSAAMARLVDASLINVDRNGASLRYRCLGLIRDRLTTDPVSNIADVKRRHTEWFLSMAAVGVEDLYGVAGNIDQVAEAIADVRAALAAGLEDGSSDAVARALARASQFFNLNNLQWELRVWLGRVLEHPLEAESRAYALRSYGSCNQMLGDQIAAIAAFEETAEIFHDLGRTDAEMRVLLSLSGAYSDAGQWALGLEAATRNHDYVSEVGELSAIAMANYYIGENLYRSGNITDALPLLTSSVDDFSTLDEHSRATYTAAMSIPAAIFAGDLDTARRLNDLAQHHGPRAERLASTENAASAAALLAIATADHPAAVRHLQSVAETVTSDHPALVSILLLPACLLFNDVGHHDTAASIASGVRAHVEKTGNALPRPWAVYLESSSALDTAPAKPLDSLRDMVTRELNVLARDELPT